MALKTTEDVSEIAGLIDNVFRGQEQLKKKAHPIASKWGGLIRGVTSDNFLQMAITETIQEKEAQKAIDRISYMLNRKFGQDTWAYILIARDEKKKQYEEALEAKRRISKNQKQISVKPCRFGGKIQRPHGRHHFPENPT